MNITELDNIIIPTETFSETKAFYEKTLRLRVKFDMTDRGIIAFQVGEGEPALIIQDRTKIPHAQYAAWLTVDNLPDALAEVMRSGGRVVEEQFDVGTGIAALIADPAGNIIGLTEYYSK